MDLDDVELRDDDTRRVERLADRREFTVDEAEAIVRFAKVDPDDRDPSQIRNFVGGGNAEAADGISEDICRRIRRDMNKADRATTVIDRYPDKHPSVIFRHATGDCSHNVDVPPTTSPRITNEECREMRVNFQTGDSFETLQATYNRSANAVVRHVFGRCGHTFENKRNGKELSDMLCVRMRRAYREYESATFEDIANSFLVHTSTARRHLRGKCNHGDDTERKIERNDSPPVGATTCRRMRRTYVELPDESISDISDAFGPECPTVHRHLHGDCRHEDAVEDAIEKESPAPIDDGECGLMRAVYGYGGDPSTIADAFDRDITAVRRHIYGRCRHDGSGNDPDTDLITPKLCKAIRHEYRNRGVESVKSIIDRLGVTKGSFHYHRRGDCSHEHDVDPAEAGNEL